MSNSANASRLAQLVSDALISRGYKVEKSIDEVELVVIASFSRTGSSISSSGTSSPSASNFARSTPMSFDTPGMTQPGLRGLSTDLRLPTPARKAGLIVTAIAKTDWQKAHEDSPKIAWRTIAIMPQFEGQDDILTELINAVGPKFP